MAKSKVYEKDTPQFKNPRNLDNLVRNSLRKAIVVKINEYFARVTGPLSHEPPKEIHASDQYFFKISVYNHDVGIGQFVSKIMWCKKAKAYKHLVRESADELRGRLEDFCCEWGVEKMGIKEMFRVDLCVDSRRGRNL